MKRRLLIGELMRRPRRPIGLLAVLALAIPAGLSSCSGGPTASLQARLLTVTDLPAGWSVSQTATSAAKSPCTSAPPPKGWAHVTENFTQGPSLPALTESLATGPHPQQEWAKARAALATCRSVNVAHHQATVRALPFPRVGTHSTAEEWTLTISGIKIGIDLVLFNLGKYVGVVSYTDLGSPNVPTVKAFVDAAVAKAYGTTRPVTGEISIASAPLQTARTTMGTVGYRAIGNGPPLVLIMGYGGTMQTWDPRFIDALAQHHRVVIFDNAGIGDTQALPAPLTIDAMADQTSALITSLGLGRPVVLGWSMGGMIAQALAVLHPTQVARLVLCATFPGVGTVGPSQAAIRALTSGNSEEATPVLFPADQKAAADAFFLALSRYPPAPAVSAATVAAQGHAVDNWWAGTDPAGRKTAEIAVPTLVADGTVDRIDPVVNDHTLARLIPGTRLVLYPDAGHAFLFQNEAAFVPAIDAFLSGATGTT